MELFEAQTASETADLGTITDTGEITRQDHDFLSFLSLFVSMVRELSTDLSLASILLDPSVNLQDPVGRGKFFSITLVDEAEISSSLSLPVETLNPLPSIVAMKVPILEGDANSPSNRKIFNSMATELQILRDTDIRSHRNIITLLGVCWHLNPDQRLLPVFVMEAAEIGNLKTFLHIRNLTPIEQVRCSIDVASGVQALHAKGVIHGDIKPENILVFRDTNNGFVAKICDFGSSILLSTVGSSCRITSGTRIWQAPEIRESEGPEALRQTDIYSTGLVLWYIFNTVIATAVMDCDPASLDLTKASGELLETVIETLDSTTIDELSAISQQRLQLQQCIFSTTLASQGSERWDIDAVLNCLLELKVTIVDEVIMMDDRDTRDTITLAPSENSNNDSQMGSRRLSVKEKKPAYLFESEDLFSVSSYQTENRLLSESQNTAYIQVNEDRCDILNLTRLSATMKILPSAVLDEMQTQLELVANDIKESMTRRATAAYQYTMCSLQRFKLSHTVYADVREPLEMLQQAASFGNQEAQYVVSILHEAFQKSIPFSSEIEIPWLITGTINGSMTARNRLSQLDLQEYKTALRILRNDYAGLGIKHNIDEGQIEDILIMHEAGISRPSPRMLQILAMIGNTNDYPKFLSFGYYDVNEVDAWGETALLVACRGGHATIAKLLLEAGADPNIASNENLTPLHFLGAFDDHDIPGIAKLLFQSNAFVEARSTAGTRFNSRIDCQFGAVEGTPLLWAVAARSLVATRTLVEFGADPFDVEGAGLSVFNEWHSSIHFSPVDFVASMHQHEFLEVMLRHIYKQSAENCATLLNNGFRTFAARPDISVLPIFWAVDYAYANLLVRLLLHGKNHKAACKKTIKTLVKYGASTAVVDNHGRSALNISSLQGHLFLTAYLLQYHDDPSNYETENLRKILFNPTIVNDYTTFDLLLRHAEKQHFQLDDTAAQENFARTAEATNNTVFIAYYLERHKWVSISNRDDTEPFERAILKGNFDCARKIFDKGRVNVTRRLQYPNGDYSTIFGRLIVRAKKFKNGVEKVEQVLSITGAAEEMFHRVLKADGEEFNALQLVCVYADYNKLLAASGPVVDLVLQAYNTTDHLNAQMSGDRHAGCTALHLAIDGGNVPAADRLLQAGINPNTLSDQGETALDKTKIRWRNQSRFMANIALEEQPAWKERHDRITVQLTNLLMQAGAVCKRYFALVKKIDQKTLFLEFFEGQLQDTIDMDSDHMYDLEDMMPGFRETTTNMKPDHMFLIGMPDNTLNAELEIQTRKQIQAMGGQAHPVSARWGMGDCLNSIESSSSSDVPHNNSSESTSSSDHNKPPLVVEIISSALSRNKVAKLAMDHDITDLCDWFREHDF